MVKLDIDTSPIENRLVRQLRDDPKLLHIVDVFYFEDHLLQKELSSAWGSSAEGSLVNLWSSWQSCKQLLLLDLVYWETYDLVLSYCDVPSKVSRRENSVVIVKR